jgi:hypothetical protein
VSKTSYVAVRFDGGPRAGEESNTRGEPPRVLNVKDHRGHYAMEWDRDDDGAKLRSATYTWSEADEADPVEPRDGDEASALLDAAESSAQGAAERKPAAGAKAAEKGEPKPAPKAEQKGEPKAEQKPAATSPTPAATGSARKSPSR